jgi:hypothetical protein
MADALDRVSVPYVVGGSVASGMHGMWRSTVDVDFVARITIKQVAELASVLGPDWYVDAEGARTGIPLGRSFNAIHMPSGDKFDIFPATQQFHERQLERAVRLQVGVYGESVECPVATAEDILLAKLRWYRDGGEVSERQWNDVQGILAMNPSMDHDYLKQWAEQLRVTDLLARAQAERDSQ